MAGRARGAARANGVLTAVAAEGGGKPPFSPAFPIVVAKADTAGPGLVVDYYIVSGNQTDYVFQSDTTYYISGNTYLWGANNIIEAINGYQIRRFRLPDCGK